MVLVFRAVVQDCLAVTQVVKRRRMHEGPVDLYDLNEQIPVGSGRRLGHTGSCHIPVILSHSLRRLNLPSNVLVSTGDFPSFRELLFV